MPTDPKVIARRGGTRFTPAPTKPDRLPRLRLVATLDAEAYPVDALPVTIRAAVEEVQGFTKAPVALVAHTGVALPPATIVGIFTDANLGAPWIPEPDIQAFAAELFHVEPSAVQVGHIAKDAVWSLEGDAMAK